jgi:hypothetical protein
MEYSSNDEFQTKIGILRENYLSKTSSAVSTVQVEETEEAEVLTESTSDVAAYLKAMVRRNK